MSDGEEEIIVCYACGAPMNVASVAPYSRVICPGCDAENRVKKQFGPYVLARRHAVGGMSSVFIAYDGTLGREVAIKILSEEYSNDEKRIAAFEEEARLTASFSHPNVVRVLTTGRAFGRLYIAMEFVPGGHFESKINARENVSEIELLPLAIEVAEGLRSAQAAGLIHRDIKPGNILLDAEGHAKIVDFGLALVTKGGTATASEIWATPYYVPPEAIEGLPEDFRSDIYAFGATLYHALAGKPPCDEETMATEKLREAKKRIVPLKRVAPDLCDETCAVIDRAMAYEPANRFASYDEMIGCLRTALKAAHGEITVDQHGVTKAERRAELRRRIRMRNILLGGAALLAVAAIGTFAALSTRKVEQVEKPPAKPTLIGSSRETVADSDEDVAARYGEARGALENGDFKTAENRFAALLEDDGVQEPTRTWAGLQAVVAPMMEGRMDDARMRSSAAEKHLSQDPEGSGARFQTGVFPVLEMVRQHRFIDPAELDLGEGNERFMGYLIAGLKNWEQGELDHAVPFFRKITGENALESDPIMAWFQQEIHSYLTDYETLSSAHLGAYPATTEECREQIEALHEMLSFIKTKGRARFSIRARLIDLAKLEKVLRNKPQPLPDDLPEGIDAMAADYRFGEIMESLSGPMAGPAGGKRDSVRKVAERAVAFMEALGASLNGKPAQLDLTLKDGTEISSLVFSEEKGLMVKLPAGEIREIAWAELPPGGLLELHRSVASGTTEDTEGLVRRIPSVCFDWLSGDRKRALEDAENFSAEDEKFRESWAAISAGLPE